MGRIGCVVVLLGLALVTAGCGGSTADAGPTTLEQAYGFQIEIDGVASRDVFLSVEGLSQHVGTVEARDAATGATTNAPTGSTPTTLTLRLEFQRGAFPTVRDWVKATYDGEDIRKSITVKVIAPDGAEVRRFNCFECFPVRFGLDGPDPATRGVVHWTLEVRVNRIEMA